MSIQRDGLFGSTNNPTEENVVSSWLNLRVNGSLLPLVLIKQWKIEYNIADLPAALKNIRGNKFNNAAVYPAVFTLPSQNMLSLVGAHEVGHFLGLDHWPDDVVSLDYAWPIDNGVKVEHLMRPGSPKFWPSDPNADTSDTSNWVVPFPGNGWTKAHGKP